MFKCRPGEHVFYNRAGFFVILEFMTRANGYDLTFENRPAYLYAEVRSEEMTEAIARAYLTEIAEKCTQTGSKYVMIYRNVPVMLPDGDLFDTTKFFLELMHGRQVAFVNPHTKISEDMEFAVRIGTNRGGVYGLFNSVAEAEEWIFETSKTAEIAKSFSEIS